MAGGGGFEGLAQIGGYVQSQESYGARLWAFNLATDSHHGLQLGVVNVADEVKGVQIGLFKTAPSVCAACRSGSSTTPTTAC